MARDGGRRRARQASSPPHDDTAPRSGSGNPGRAISLVLLVSACASWPDVGRPSPADSPAHALGMRWLQMLLGSNAGFAKHQSHLPQTSIRCCLHHLFLKCLQLLSCHSHDLQATHDGRSKAFQSASPNSMCSRLAVLAWGLPAPRCSAWFVRPFVSRGWVSDHHAGFRRR